MKTADLREKRCPETFLYTKLALETVEHGQSLTVLFGSRDDAERVQRSVVEEGFEILEAMHEEESGGYRIVIGT